MKHLARIFMCLAIFGIPAALAAGGPYSGGGPFAGNGSSGGGGGSSSPNVSNATGTLPVANGGDAQVGGLVVNSTGSAATNSTAINAALAAGGRVTVDCPTGATLYIGATLIIPSYSSLYVYPNCTPTAVSGVAPLVTNKASQAAWTTLYDASGVITTGPLSLINLTNVGTWSNNSGSGTAYTKGTYIKASSNIYWESVTSCTGATSGTGPSGTGTGITDGSCSWNYVTAYPTGVTQGVVVHYPSHGLSIGQAVWLTPEGDASLTGNFWSGTQSAHTRGGPVDAAYLGIFPIINVNDSNYVTVVLRRSQAAAFTGIPMLIKQADQNVYLGGGAVWNGNYPTNNTCSSPAVCHNILFAGVMNLVVDGAYPEDQNRFELLLAGVENADIGHVGIGPAGAPFDGIKVYGPAFDLRLHDVFGASTDSFNTDDFLSFNTEEDSTFGTSVIAAGDILDVQATNITAYGGHGVALYQSLPLLFMDELDFSSIQGNNLQAYVPMSIINDAGSTSGQGGTIGTLKLHNITLPGASLASSIIYVNAVGLTLNHLILDSITTSLVSSNLYLANFTGGTINGVEESNNTGLATDKLNLIAGATVGQVNFTNNNITCSNCRVMDGESGTLGNLNIVNNEFLGGANNLVLDKIGIKVSFVNNYLPSATSAFINLQASDSIYAANNIAPNNTGGLAASTGAITSTITSGGGNVFSGSSWFSGAGTAVTTGIYNGALQLSGVYGLWQDTTNWNLIVGDTSFVHLSQPGGFDGQLNTALGQNTLVSITTGYNNTAIGGGAAGVAAMSSTTTGHSNVGIGAGALTLNTTGAENIVVGSSLEFCQTCANDVLLGNDEMVTSASVAGNDNVGVGEGALNLNNANFNTAVGYEAMASNTTGSLNVAVGYNALTSSTVGVDLTAVGNAALTANTTGTDNTAIGYLSLSTETLDVGDTAVGSFALHTLATNSTQSNNVAIGYGALYSATTGIENTAIGAGIGGLSSFTTAHNNTLIGYGVASTTLATGHNNILIGTSTTTDTNGAADSNEIAIGGAGLGSNTFEIGLSGSTTSGRLYGAVTMDGFNLATTGGSFAHWTTTSPVWNIPAVALTDTTGSGAVTTEAAVTINPATFSSSSSITVQNLAELYIGLPIASTNVTATNIFSLVTAGGIDTTFLTTAGIFSSGGSVTVSGAATTLRNQITSSSGRAVNTGTTADTVAASIATTFESANTAAGAFTVTLAAPTGDGERRRICFKNNTGTITWTVTSPATATSGLPTSMTAGQCAEMVYSSASGTPTNAAATTWYQF